MVTLSVESLLSSYLNWEEINPASMKSKRKEEYRVSIDALIGEINQKIIKLLREKFTLGGNSPRVINYSKTHLFGYPTRSDHRRRYPPALQYLDNFH